MNLANLIDDGKLKKSFIVATLVSTVIGTFTASMALHDKVQEKKQKKEQKALDGKQDDEIKKLQEEFKQVSNKREQSRSSSRSQGSRRRRRRDRSDEEEEDFRRSTRRARAMIEQQYEDNLLRLGPRYAQGDVITENKLQAQIIQLQQTVINVLQNALLNERSLTKDDINKLIAAQQAARDGSMDALNGQYSRMIAEQPPRQKLLPDAHSRRDRFMESEEPALRPMHRQLTLPASRPRSPSPLRRIRTAPAPSPHLFCHYSEDLQDSRNNLLPSFDPGGSHRCPACSLHIRISSSDAWTLEMRKPVIVSDGYGGEQEAITTRTYEVSGRFVIKCHTEDGEFACVLCQQYRDVDSICGNAESLVQHLGQSHTSDQFEREVDLLRVSR